MYISASALFKRTVANVRDDADDAPLVAAHECDETGRPNVARVRRHDRAQRIESLAMWRPWP
jgi:hypothetical protein